MCVEGSKGAMNVKGAFSEASNLALLLIYTFPITIDPHILDLCCYCAPKFTWLTMIQVYYEI